ncbi:MAG: hypothetical protein J0H69_00670 [Burkholderiales bacterium]|nr:hypothetical protein [Burkholderiales bacterium]
MNWTLKPPKVGGPAELRLFVDDVGGLTRACKLIDVSEATMRRWLREDGRPPLAALQALYWLTKWGFSDACSEAHWSHQYLLGKIRQLEACLAFEAPVRRAANEPMFHQPPGRVRTGWRGGRRRVSF